MQVLQCVGDLRHHLQSGAVVEKTVIVLCGGVMGDDDIELWENLELKQTNETAIK